MNTVDQDRVDKARKRLESATRKRSVDGLRITKVNAPADDAEPILLNRKLTVVGGLSGSGLRTLYGTIDGMRRDAASDTGLGAIIAEPGDINTSIDPGLEAVIERCEQAIMVTEAEIRGASLALEDLDAKIHDTPDAPNPAAQAEFDDEFVPFITQCLDVSADANNIQYGLEAVRLDPRRAALEEACSPDIEDIDGVMTLDDAASGTMLFGGKGATGNSDLRQAEAEGELSEYDMAPGSPAYVLASRLDHVGIETSPLDAVDVATRLLHQIDLAMAERLEFEAGVRAAGGDASNTVDERDRTRDARSETQRRLTTLKHLNAIAYNQLADVPARFSPMPLMLVDPFFDIPSDLAEVTLSMLLKRTSSSQVIIACNSAEVHKWCSSAGEEATSIQLDGWFAREHDGW